MDYKFGQKNNWRRSIWNAIKKRLTKPAKSALVLYLGSIQDIDRTIALSKGFSHNNLLFVDKSLDVVKNKRNAGVLSIDGEFTDIVKSWPKSVSLDVIYADFCGGLTADRWQSLAALTFIPQVRNSILAFNFLRGRDSTGNEHRKIFSDILPDAIGKHRGKIFTTHFICESYGHAQGHFNYTAKGYEPKPDYINRLKNEQQNIQDYLRYLSDTIKRPDFFEYRSTAHQTFDSSVFIHPLAGIPLLRWHDFDEKLYKSGSGNMRRKIAAVLAHRTMRFSN